MNGAQNPHAHRIVAHPPAVAEWFRREMPTRPADRPIGPLLAARIAADLTAGILSPPQPPPRTLDSRVASLERRVAALEAGSQPAPKAVAT